jgi:polysaccharide biosynthesis protein PelA
MRLFFLFLFIPFSLQANTMQRRVVTFWDSTIDKRVDNSLVHKVAELPLNHIGIDLIYYDIHEPLPDLSQRDDILGVLLCFLETTRMKDPKSFIGWASDTIDQGKKIVIMRSPGFLADLDGNFTSQDTQNYLYEKMGFTNTQKWIDYTFKYKISTQDKEIFPFEKKLSNPLPGFSICKAHASMKSYLTVEIPDDPESTSDLILVGKNGAYVSELFTCSFDEAIATNSPTLIGWYFNPFNFFEIVFDLNHHPVPDTTTLAGRRIYFSTCHGDSWNMPTSLKEYKKQDISCAKVVLEKALKPYPSMPATVAIVAADIDPDWAGKEISQEVAEETFDLPQVEPGTHTYSHPFDWQFFKDGGDLEEVNYLHLYPYGTWQNSYISWFRSQYNAIASYGKKKTRKLKEGYATPRAYATLPFNIERETVGSMDYINQFTEEKRPASIVIWSGDALPWDTVVSTCYENGFKNQSGSTCRYDAIYPSILSVCPLARKPGGFIQIHNAANGDNGYTNEWKDNFYAFKYVTKTWANLETPRRLKPIHLYYHSYSGQFQESIDALVHNIEYAKKQTIIPVSTRRYCEVGEGFFSADFEILSSRSWRVLNRKGLDTIRFEHAKKITVDYSLSKGVLGHTRHQGSLYLYLDGEDKEPIIAIQNDLGEKQPLFLIDSSWEVFGKKIEGNIHHYTGKGWGKFIMRWHLPAPYTKGIIKIEGVSLKKIFQAKDHVLLVDLDLPFDKEVSFSLEVQ